MTFYKIIQDNKIIDVNYKFFRYQKRHLNIIACSPEEAQLIQSSDNKEFYSTEWLKPLPNGVHCHKIVQARIIAEDEYNELKKELEISEVLLEPAQPIASMSENENIDEQSIQAPIEQVVNIRELYEKLQLLEKELQSLKK